MSPLLHQTFLKSFIVLISLQSLMYQSNTIPCPLQSLPKVIGGSGGGTFLYAIDYHAGLDKLAVAGRTYDQTLIPTFLFSDSIPIAALYSRNTMSLIWAKGIHLDGDYFFSAIFNKEGNYLFLQASSKIIVMTAGNVVNAILTPS